MRERARKILTLVSIVFIYMMSVSSGALAHGVCPVTTLKVSQIKGQVVTEGRKPEPVALTKIELFALREKETLVAVTLTDEKGLFEFSDISKGEYRSVAHFTVKGITYLEYDFILDLRDKVSSKDPPSMILVRLGLDCFESSANLIHKRELVLR